MKRGVVLETDSKDVICRALLHAPNGISVLGNKLFSFIKSGLLSLFWFCSHKSVCMNTEDIVQKIEQYITGFCKQHEEHYYSAFNDAHSSYQTSAARHSDSRLARIEDIVDNLECNIGVIFYSRPLIPAAYPSLQGLIVCFHSFRSEIQKHIDYIKRHYNLNSVLPSHISDVLNICGELQLFCDEILRTSTELDMPSAYIKCREYLYSDNIDGFLECVNQVLSTIPYSVFKQNVNESFFHVCLVLLLTLIGFNVNAEEAISRGRIDATLILHHTAYIFEFKYSASGINLSKKALQQIIKKGYIEKYKLCSKIIQGIGVSFSAKKRRINGHIRDVLWQSEN